MQNKSIQWVAFKGLFHKETRRFIRIWQQSLLPSWVTALLLFLIFGQVIGHRIGDMEGYNYLVFIVPGITMLSIITNSYANVVSSFYSARFMRAFEEIQVSPMRVSTIIFGYIGAGVLRGVIIGIGVLIIACFFEPLPMSHPFLALLCFILSGSLFAFAGLINGIFANSFDDTAFVTTFVLTPLIFLGGVFYNINSLPHFWRVVSEFNPIYYIIDLARYALLSPGSSDYWQLPLAMIIGFNILLYACAWTLMRKGVRIQS